MFENILLKSYIGNMIYKYLLNIIQLNLINLMGRSWTTGVDRWTDSEAASGSAIGEVRQSIAKNTRIPISFLPILKYENEVTRSLIHMAVCAWFLDIWIYETKLHRRCHSINRLSTMDTVTIEHGYVCELHPVGHKTNDCLLVRWFGINLLTSCIEPSILWMLFLARGNIVQNK